MIKVDIKSGPYIKTHPKAKTRTFYDKVWLSFGNNKVEFTVPAAHKIAFALIRKAIEATRDKCYIILTINQVDVHLLPEEAKQIGASLLIRSEYADTFQRSLAC